MDYGRSILAFFARASMSALFLASGVNKIIYWTESEKTFMRAAGDWQVYTVASDACQAFFGAVLLWAPFILAFFTGLQLIGGLLLLLGRKERLGAFFLILFLLPMTVLTEPFWFLEGLQQESALSLFLRDLAVLGGLFLVVLHGAHGATAVPDLFSREE